MSVLPKAENIDAPAALALLEALIVVPSVNPAYDPESSGENELGDAMLAWFEEIGCVVGATEVVEGRRNIFARLPSRTSRRQLLIEAHLDTVGLPAGSITPEAHEVDGRVHGRGACDVKGAIAAAMLAMAELARNPLEHTDIAFLGAIDEEFEFRGISRFIADGALPDLAVVLEPTDLRVVAEHNGVVRVELLVSGRAAHTSRPSDGHNAILDALATVAHLEEWNAAANRDRAPGEAERILAVTTIAGGSAINVIPDSCTLGIDLRIVPRDVAQTVLDDLRSFLLSLASEGIDVAVGRVLLLDGGMFTAPDTTLVRAAQFAVGLQQLPVEVARVPYGTDGSKLSRAGVATIVFGPGSIEQAHGDDEWVELDDVVTAAGVLRDLARAIDRAEP